MIGESILDHETNATDESIKSYEYDISRLLVHNLIVLDRLQ